MHYKGFFWTSMYQDTTAWRYGLLERGVEMTFRLEIRDSHISTPPTTTIIKSFIKKGRRLNTAPISLCWVS